MFEHKPKHVIYLIHGIGGNKTHFGHMVPALRRTLHKKDPSTKYVIKNVIYETGHDEKTSYDFAKDLASEINRLIQSSRFKEDDKFSLIMHSQGGLVGAIWMFQSLLENPEYSPKKAVDHLDAFITLGTPFWGAKIATWGSQMKTLTKQVGVKIPVPFGQKELEEMSFGSDTIFDFRQALIEPQYRPQIEYLRSRVRFLNVVGVADAFNPLGIFVSGVDKYEDDGAVPMASARFNFLYSQSIKADYDANDRVRLENMQEVTLAPYVVVNALHVSPVPEMANFSGIAQIPKNCIKNENYIHPTFSYIWKHILGYPVEQVDKKLGDFKTVLIDINIRIDHQQTLHNDDLKIEFRSLDGSGLSGSNIEISNAFELYSKGNRRSSGNTNHWRYYYTGHIKRQLDNRKETLLMVVSKNGYKSRLFEIEIKTACSTFVDLNLIPDR
ncbi:MAG: esterase/lipase family protein [Candidatus Omnitrophota bacterium]